MQSSTITNTSISKIGSNYYILLKGSKSCRTVIQISERQALKGTEELEIKLIDNDSTPIDTKISGHK